MRAYYNILTTLKANLEADAFCNTVTQGDIFDIDLNKQEIFPLSHIVINNTTKEKNVLVFNVTVLCMDIVDLSKDEATDTFIGNDNEQDVLNTQLAVGLRLVEVLERGGSNSTFMMRGTPSFEPFTERFENNMAGWAVTFDIYVPNTMIACDAVATGAVCNPANVSNSDGSYVTTAASGGSLTLPDIDINVNGTDEGDIPSVTDVSVNLTNSFGTVTPDAVNVTGSTVAITLPDSAPNPVGATLMKTGQTTSYATGDDGDLQAGRATDAFTLSNANPFNNTNRYTDELGGQTYTNNIVIDWSTYDTGAGTVLGYYRITGGPDTWSGAVSNAAATSVGSFTTGWRLTNMNELHNLAKIGSAAPASQGRAFNWSPINQGNSNTRYWSASTLDNYTNQPYHFTNFFGGGGISATQLYNWLACRTFTVTGTTLT